MFIVPSIAMRTIETHNIAMAINFLRNFLSILSPAHFFYFMLYVHWVQWTFRCFICQYKIFSLIISIFVIFQYLSISFISIIRIVYQAKMLPQNYVAIFLLNRKIGISFWAGFEVLFGEFMRFQLLFSAFFRIFAPAIWKHFYPNIMIKGSKGIIDTRLHAIRCIP